MKKNKVSLGMQRKITRRDFIHDTGLAALGLTLGANAGAAASASPAGTAAVYPPTLTGLRGSQPGVEAVPHAMRDGASFRNAALLDEDYDLVVVGGGISGLAAARFYQKRFGPDARILILENHDDFGGHARRNEFHQAGKMCLSLGGTHNLEHWEFSDTVNGVMDELGIDIEKMRSQMEFDYGNNSREGPAIYFDKESFGVDKLVTGFTLMGFLPSMSLDPIDEFPVSKEARAQLKYLYGGEDKLLPDMSEDQMWEYLSSISYPEFLQRHVGAGEEVQMLLAKTTHGNYGYELRALSASEALWEGLPGLNLLGMASESEGWNYPVAMFPDGNAGVARLQVAQLIPAVAPGTNADNVSVAKFDYARLDEPGSPVRLRLNSTVTNVTNTKDGAETTYVLNGEAKKVRSRHSVLACYHSVIPHICPELPQWQRDAMKHQVKTPLVLTNVLLKSSKPMNELGINVVRCPGRLHGRLFLFNGINTGGYSHPMDDEGPVPLVFWGTISPEEAITLDQQLRASRQLMLELSFEDYEREVRTVLDGLLGPAGFNVEEDILAITVNRWPHGYAYEYMDLWDDEYLEGEAPHELARTPRGAISIANSDAGASAYTHVAIDEAFRAVQELPSGAT